VPRGLRQTRAATQQQLRQPAAATEVLDPASLWVHASCSSGMTRMLLPRVWHHSVSQSVSNRSCRCVGWAQ
jgi:hypothetical protein